MQPEKTKKLLNNNKAKYSNEKTLKSYCKIKN